MVCHRAFRRAAAVVSLFAGTVGSVNALSIEQFTGNVTIKFTAFYTENAGTVGTGPNGASGGKETNWGAGYVTSIFETGNPVNTIWHSGKNNETLSVFIYGIADVAIIQNGPSNFSIYQNGATSAPFSGADGKIHIDFYRDSTGGTNPSFTASLAAPDAARASTSDRTGFSTMGGMTDGTLEMRWELVPSPLTAADPLALITILFTNTNAATAPASGDGNFYATCVTGPLCDAFKTNVQTTGLGTLADFAGGFDLTPVIPSGIEANPAYPNAVSNGWLVAIDDPILAVTTGTIPPPPPPTTPADHVAAVSESLTSLITDGALGAKDANGLFPKLDAVSKALTENDTATAADLLRALSNRVRALERSHRISAADAASLQQMIASALASLG